jgi:hypothetical protein
MVLDLKLVALVGACLVFLKLVGFIVQPWCECHSQPLAPVYAPLVLFALGWAFLCLWDRKLIGFKRIKK